MNAGPLERNATDSIGQVMAKRRPLGEHDWAEDRIKAWETMHRSLKELVQLRYLKPGWRVLLFPDASVSAEEYDSGMGFEKI